MAETENSYVFIDEEEGTVQDWLSVIFYKIAGIENRIAAVETKIDNIDRARERDDQDIVSAATISVQHTATIARQIQQTKDEVRQARQDIGDDIRNVRGEILEQIRALNLATNINLKENK